MAKEIELHVNVTGQTCRRSSGDVQSANPAIAGEGEGGRSPCISDRVSETRWLGELSSSIIMTSASVAASPPERSASERSIDAVNSRSSDRRSQGDSCAHRYAGSPGPELTYVKSKFSSPLFEVDAYPIRDD